MKIRIIIDFVAPDELVDYDRHVANEVSHADGAYCLGHALVKCRKLIMHVVTENGAKERFCNTPFTINWLSYLKLCRYVEEDRTILHSPKLQQNIVQRGSMTPNA